MRCLHKLPIAPGIDKLINLAIEEDIGHGDITTGPMDLSSRQGRAVITAKEPLVIAGLQMVPKVYKRLGDNVSCRQMVKDGDWIDTAGTIVAQLSGDMETLLLGERIALNFLQRLSGIATNVRNHINKIPAGSVRLTDTRKTVPGWRVLEKYAVRVGGGFNHRMGLYDGVLIKDNHIAACGSITKAVAAVRKHISHLICIEVETETIDQVKEALEAGVDVIMLDNMENHEISEAVSVIGSRAVIEVSGRVDAQRISHLAQLGVQIISMGALTHGARFVDIGMSIEALAADS
jgi:nicotinate-nucleotide pyrophosphorylase (carboxylating)